MYLTDFCSNQCCLLSFNVCPDIPIAGFKASVKPAALGDHSYVEITATAGSNMTIIIDFGDNSGNHEECYPYFYDIPSSGFSVGL